MIATGYPPFRYRSIPSGLAYACGYYPAPAENKEKAKVCTIFNQKTNFSNLLHYFQLSDNIIAHYEHHRNHH